MGVHKNIDEHPDKDMVLEGNHLRAICEYQDRLRKLLIEFLVIVGLLVSGIILRGDRLVWVLLILFITFVVRFILKLRVPSLQCCTCGKKMVKDWRHIHGLPSAKDLFLVCKHCKKYVPVGIHIE